MYSSTEDDAVHLGVVLVSREHCDPLFEIYRPVARVDEAVSYISLGLEEIIIISLDGSILDSIESFYLL